MAPSRFLLLAYVAGFLPDGCGRPQAYAADARPVLQNRCRSCHQSGGGGDEAGGFRLANYAGLRPDARHGPVIILEYGLFSLLMRLVEHKANRALNRLQGKARIPAADPSAIGIWIEQGVENNQGCCDAAE